MAFARRGLIRERNRNHARQRNVRVGSLSDSPDDGQKRPLLRGKRSFSVEKRASIFECLHSGRRRTNCPICQYVRV